MPNNKWPERGIRAARTVQGVLRAIWGSSQEELEAKAEQARLDDIRQKRQTALAYPGFQTLVSNTRFQRWRKDPAKVHEVDPFGSYNAIANNWPVNQYFEPAVRWERTIDPERTEEEIHRMCIEYCNTTAGQFTSNAAGIARRYSKMEQTPTTDSMLDAITVLMGAGPSWFDLTIFKDVDWSDSYYAPDYRLLGVNIDELEVPRAEIMAGVGLCIGLWINLADQGASRPLSGRNFGPIFERASFMSLVVDTGWADYTGMGGMYREGIRNAANGRPFLDHFRSPDFFATTYEAFRANPTS